MATIETYDRITLDMLTRDSVSILKRTYALINGVEAQVGENWRRAYVNNSEDRKSIAEFLGEDSPELAAVMAIWGDEPTIVPETPNEPSVDEEETSQLTETETTEEESTEEETETTEEETETTEEE